MGEKLIDIGPQIFGKADGSVICWKGINYVRQDDAKQAIYQAAGFGASCVIGEAPAVVMPTDKLIPGCERIFQEMNSGELKQDG